jgi:MFS transporter, DHA1 family, multidrug resistance protein
VFRREDEKANMPNPFIFVAVLSAVFMLAPFAIDMYLPALPTIAQDLNASIDQIEATVAILLFGYALGQLVLGPLSDRFGRVPILLLGLITFAVASALASIVQSVEQLYLCRLFQAFGGAGSVVVFPMVRDRFDEQRSGQIVSYIMAATVVAPLIAPIIGAYILLAAGWEAIFLTLAAMGLATFVAAKLTVKPQSTPSARRAAFSIKSILAAYRIVLGNWTIMAHILAGGFAFAGLFAFVAGSPFVYITYFGVAPQTYGYLIGLNAAAMIGANLINAQLLPNVDTTLKTIIGAILLAIAAGPLIAINLAGANLPIIVAGIVAYVGALGFTATNAIVGALSQLPEENGTVSAINGATQFSIGAASSLIISVTASTNATPMIITMAACGLLALIAALTLHRKPLAQQGTENA